MHADSGVCGRAAVTSARSGCSLAITTTAIATTAMTTNALATAAITTTAIATTAMTTNALATAAITTTAIATAAMTTTALAAATLAAPEQEHEATRRWPSPSPPPSSLRARHPHSLPDHLHQTLHPHLLHPNHHHLTTTSVKWQRATRC